MADRPRRREFRRSCAFSLVADAAGHPAVSWKILRASRRIDLCKRVRQFALQFDFAQSIFRARHCRSRRRTRSRSGCAGKGASWSLRKVDHCPRITHGTMGTPAMCAKADTPGRRARLPKLKRRHRGFRPQETFRQFGLAFNRSIASRMVRRSARCRSVGQQSIARRILPRIGCGKNSAIAIQSTFRRDDRSDDGRIEMADMVGRENEWRLSGDGACRP